MAIDEWQAGRSEAAEVVHLRKGEIDEWRRVFSPAQAQAAAARLPDVMVERFGCYGGNITVVGVELFA